MEFITETHDNKKILQDNYRNSEKRQENAKTYMTCISAADSRDRWSLNRPVCGIIFEKVGFRTVNSSAHISKPIIPADLNSPIGSACTLQFCQGESFCVLDIKHLK